MESFYEGMDVLAVREATRFAIDYCSVQAKVTLHCNNVYY